MATCWARGATSPRPKPGPVGHERGAHGHCAQAHLERAPVCAAASTTRSPLTALHACDNFPLTHQEVELLPTLFSVGHNSFPGVFETVYIVNAGWSHRAMWNSVVKRLLPRSAIDKVVFLESKEQTAEVLNLDSLPSGELNLRAEELTSAYGGSGLEPDPEIMLRRYSIARPHSYSRQGSRAGSRVASRATSRNASRAGSRASSCDPPRRIEPSRNASTSSIADVYYTAPPSPVSRSRPPSRKNSSLGLSGLSAKLAMTKHDEDISESKQKVLIDTSASTVQRIKSLSDFHLYLSPSRLAHRDLLSDSEEDEPSPHPPPPPPVDRPRRTLRPAILELGAGSIAARRAVSRQGITASSTPGSARASTPAEYASQLQAHHARGLEQYYSPERQSSYIEAMSSPEHSSDVSPASPPDPLASDSPSGDDGEDEYAPAPSSPQILVPTPVRAIAAPPSTPPAAEAPDVQFSTSNPWFGYPVVRVPHQNGEGYAIRPRYGRNRKRDLVKTLLWLFVLRLQTWRSAIERALGLNRVISLFSARKPEERPTPTEGLRKVAETRAYAPKGGAVAKRTDRDWIWMVIGFLLLRGTWTRLLAAPMESAGLGIVRDVLGLATS